MVSFTGLVSILLLFVASGVVFIGGLWLAGKAQKLDHQYLNGSDDDSDDDSNDEKKPDEIL